MLFNSYVFLLGFLPLCLIGYQVAGHIHRRAVVAWLGLASLGFYAYWKPAFLVVLLSSIAINYTAASLISRRIPNKVSTGLLLWLSIATNLGVLCYFKYLFPLLNFLSHGFHGAHGFANVALPLGISFFTFTQIAYLVDLQQGVAQQQDILSYVLFVTFFPHLIAGPILHHKDMMPQFQQQRVYRLRASDLAVGFSWFLMGLGKKVLIADTFAQTADPAFAAAGHLGFGAAWLGSLCYAFQLYFDFSGYSDMALGLARMFSIDFPLNFNSPFKSTGIIDFWQRWHITLSNYIMDYLYSPLQFKIRARRREQGKPVNRASLTSASGFSSMIAFPMLFTMLVVGIWHGAGLKYILFGLIHGVYFVINHAWRLWRPRSAAAETRVRKSLADRAIQAGWIVLTFIAVLFAWNFFRAADVHSAVGMSANMLGLHTSDAQVLFAGDTAGLHARLAEIVAAFVIVWFFPNTQQILRNYKPSLQHEAIAESTAHRRWLLWTPGMGWAVALGLVFVASLFCLQNASTFLYFQF